MLRRVRVHDLHVERTQPAVAILRDVFVVTIAAEIDAFGQRPAQRRRLEAVAEGAVQGQGDALDFQIDGPTRGRGGRSAQGVERRFLLVAKAQEQHALGRDLAFTIDDGVRLGLARKIAQLGQLSDPATQLFVEPGLPHPARRPRSAPPRAYPSGT